MSGFRSIRRPVAVTAGGRRRITIELSVAALQETIAVAAQTPVIDARTTRQGIAGMPEGVAGGVRGSVVGGVVGGFPAAPLAQFSHRSPAPKRWPFQHRVLRHHRGEPLSSRRRRPALDVLYRCRHGVAPTSGGSSTMEDCRRQARCASRSSSTTSDSTIHSQQVGRHSRSRPSSPPARGIHAIDWR